MGGVVLVVCVEFQWIKFPLLFLILLSAITSPHTLVMEGFYRHFKRRQFSA